MLASLNGSSSLPPIESTQAGVFSPPREPISFSSDSNEPWSGVDAEVALMAIVSSTNVQEAIGLDRQGLLRRFANKWTPELALKECTFLDLSIHISTDTDTFMSAVERTSNHEAHRGDGISPLLKISPALMHIENMSLQSLARSTRGVGVTDLREALEGRSSMSNPALVRPPSISTLDHTSIHGGDLLSSHRTTPTRPKSRKQQISTHPGEVRDVLNKLGIGKQQGGSLLKASFPALQKSDER